MVGLSVTARPLNRLFTDGTLVSPTGTATIAATHLGATGLTEEQNIVIRPLRADDRANWHRLWTDYLAFYETTVPQAVYDSTFARLLGDDPRDFNGMIAEIDGKAVGLVHYLFHRHGWRIEDTCYLQDLYVDPDLRGTGLGRRLIEAVYAAADAHGAATVYWLTQEFNTTARQLYDRIAKKTPFVHYSSARPRNA